MNDYEAVTKQLMEDMKAAQERHKRGELGDAEYACIMRNLAVAMAHTKSAAMQLGWGLAPAPASEE